MLDINLLTIIIIVFIVSKKRIFHNTNFLVSCFLKIYYFLKNCNGLRCGWMEVDLSENLQD
jgi:hypothetical protein